MFPAMMYQFTENIYKGKHYVAHNTMTKSLKAEWLQSRYIFMPTTVCLA